jgi:hypothetical protein
MVNVEKMKQTYDLEERLLEEKMNVQHRTSNPDKIGIEWEKMKQK